jgi:TatD DNase family protein
MQNNITPFFGLHPWYVTSDFNKRLAEVKTYLDKSESFGIGEIGLDLGRCKDTIDIQLEAFEKQILLAKELNRPVAIHGVHAFDLIHSVLNKLGIKHINAILHRFEGNKDELKKLVKKGFFISFFYTLHERQKIKEAFTDCPLERILLESDSGNGDEHDKLLEHYKKSAEIKNIKLDNFIGALIKNGEIFKSNKFAGQ